MHVMKILTAAVLAGLILAGGVAAQAPPVADLELEIVVEPVGLKPPGSRGHFRFTLTNLGPDPAGSGGTGIGTISVHSGSIPSFVEYDPVIRLDPLGSGPCVPFRRIDSGPPGYPVVVAYAFLFDRMEPGESRVCEFEFFIDPAVDFDIPWRWWASSSLDNDPTPNHHLIVDFLIGNPHAIPTLSTAGIVVLSLAFLAAFALVQRRRRHGVHTKLQR